MVPSQGGARHLNKWLREQLDTPELADNADFVLAAFEDRKSLEAAMDGVSAAVMIIPSIMDEGIDPTDLQSDFFDAAVQAGVRRMVNLSGSAVDAEVPTQVGQMLAVGEALLEASGMEYTHLRFPLFMLMQNVRVYAKMIRKTNQIMLPLGARQVAMIDARDIAAAAAVTLTEPGHTGQTYMLTGPAAIDGYQVAEALTQIRRKQTDYVPVVPDVARQILQSMTVPQFLIEDALALYADGVSLNTSVVTDSVRKLTGNPPRTIQDYVAFESWAWGESEGQLNGWNE
jgi:uncharacterized protein YbjT (DUF2867 family)